MSKLKDDITDTTINVALHNVIKREFSKIQDQNGVIIKYDKDNYGDFIYIRLQQYGKILIDLCINTYTVDMIVGNYTTPIYEAEKIIDKRSIIDFSDFLNVIMNNSIDEIEYLSGRIEYRISGTDRIIYTNKNFLDFLFPKRIIKETHYKKWI
ncbi:MAG: hypothetical protein IPM42_13325 [Saprospiraceae bacterium]|nr:hypothetical protein [Saprospiraceae bacterium]